MFGDFDQRIESDLFGRKLQVSKNCAKWIFFLHLKVTFVSVACFARSVECDSLGDFQKKLIFTTTHEQISLANLPELPLIGRQGVD